MTNELLFIMILFLSRVSNSPAGVQMNYFLSFSYHHVLCYNVVMVSYHLHSLLVLIQGIILSTITYFFTLHSSSTFHHQMCSYVIQWCIAHIIFYFSSSDRYPIIIKRWVMLDFESDETWYFYYYEHHIVKESCHLSCFWLIQTSIKNQAMNYNVLSAFHCILKYSLTPLLLLSFLNASSLSH